MLRSLSVVLGLVILCGGCSVQSPTASFKSMAVSDVSVHGFTMNVKIDVKNPNNVTIPVADVDYSLMLGGAKLVENAKFNPGGTLPAKGTSTVTLVIPLTFENLLTVEEAIRKGDGNVKYGVESFLSFDNGSVPYIGGMSMGGQRVPFNYEGTLNVGELLKKNWSTILANPAAKELAQKVLGGLLKF